MRTLTNAPLPLCIAALRLSVTPGPPDFLEDSEHDSAVCGVYPSDCGGAVRWDARDAVAGQTTGAARPAAGSGGEAEWRRGGGGGGDAARLAARIHVFGGRR